MMQGWRFFVNTTDGRKRTQARPRRWAGSCSSDTWSEKSQTFSIFVAALANGKSFTCGFVTEGDWKINGAAMTTVCPICKLAAEELDSTGDATGYACPMHGNFKVANSVFAEAKAKDYTREQWEAALDKAQERTEPEGWPLIITDDFF
jgi:hypothetical protein